MRYTFGGYLADWSMIAPSTAPALATADGQSVAGAVLAAANLPVEGESILVAEEPGGTLITDLVAIDGFTEITSPITDANGFIVPFKADDERRALAISTDNGTTWWWMIAVDALVEAAESVPPFVIIGPVDTAPPVGTPAGALIFREVF